MTHAPKKGFTLMEIIIALAILGLVATLLFGGLASFRARSELKTGVSTVYTVLQSARQKTLSSENLSSYGVFVDESSLTLFAGEAYDEEDDENVLYDLGTTIRLTADVNGGGDTIVFERLTGETEDYGTITVTAEAGDETVIVIGQTGIIYEE